MADVAGLDGVAVDDGASVLSGDVVRALVTRHEEELEALVVRAEEIESEAEAVERAVREHPGFALLDPDEAARLVPVPPVPGPVDDGRPRTTVVQRSAPEAPAGARTERSARPPVGAQDDLRPGFFGRLGTSHWWWRIGIALVVVALVLLKVG